MTISASTNDPVRYNGNAVTVAFTTPIFHVEADLKVYVDDVLQTLTTDYTVTGGSGSTGTVTFVTAPPSGTDNVIIVVDPLTTQTLDLTENGINPAEDRETQFDKLVLLIQRLMYLKSRSLVQSDLDNTDSSLTLPLEVNRASNFLAFDSDGDPIASAGTTPDGVTVSAFVETLLDDADADAFWTTLMATITKATARSSLEVAIETFASKAACVTYITANGVTNDQVYFITSTDGGTFRGITGAAASTYADDGGSSCGTQFIPTGGDGSTGLVREFSDHIHTDYFGITFDGSTDDRAAWVLALAAATANNVKIVAANGTSLIQGNLAPGANCELEGQGKGVTILKFQNTGATLIGMTCVNGLRVSNLTMQADVNSQTWCATHGFSATCADVSFKNIKFLGTTTKTGNWAGWVSSGDADRVTYLDCDYELLTFGIAKDNSDTSDQYDWQWHRCTFTNITDAININSPAGSWQKVVVKGCDFDDISQFPVAFAGTNCATSVVCDNRFYDTEYEALHYEASTHSHRAHDNEFQFTNQTAGVVGSPGAENGAVQVLTGAYDVDIYSNTFNLTQNTTGSPNGLVAQSGGGGTVGNVSFRDNTVFLKAGCIAVYANEVGYNAGAYDAGLDISGNTFINDSGSKSSKILDIPFSILSGGGNKFVNPGVVMDVDDNSFGGLRDSQFIGDLSTLDFLTGNTDAATSVVFNNFQLREDFTVDVSATWQDVVPDGTLYDGIVSMRYLGNGASDAFTKTVRLTSDSGSLTIASEQANAVGGVDPMPGAPHWQISGGYLQSKAYRATTQNGQVVFTFTGAWYP